MNQKYFLVLRPWDLTKPAVRCGARDARRRDTCPEHGAIKMSLIDNSAHLPVETSVRVVSMLMKIDRKTRQSRVLSCCSEPVTQNYLSLRCLPLSLQHSSVFLLHPPSSLSLSLFRSLSLPFSLSLSPLSTLVLVSHCVHHLAVSVSPQICVPGDWKPRHSVCREINFTHWLAQGLECRVLRTGPESVHWGAKEMTPRWRACCQTQTSRSWHRMPGGVWASDTPGGKGHEMNQMIT